MSGKIGALKALAEGASNWANKTFYRGLSKVPEETQAVSGLKMVERGPVPASGLTKANTRDYVWSSDNPFVAETYTDRRGIMIPMELKQEPDAIFDAGGSHWGNWFFKNNDPRSLNRAYQEALLDPAVRSVLVKNIMDYGPESASTGLMRRLYAKKYGVEPEQGMRFGAREIEDLDEMLLGNSLLIKNPSIMRYKYSTPQDVPRFAKGGAVDTPDPREHKPYNRAANPITQLVRGWAAGTAGLPGDLEGLARMAARYAGANVDEAPALPTSEFYKEWLPGRDTAVGGPEMEGLGAFFGGAGSTALVRPVAPALKALGRAAETSARAGARNLAVPRQLSPQAGVIKLPGGNWLSGSVEGALGGLKRKINGVPAEEMLAREAEWTPEALAKIGAKDPEWALKLGRESEARKALAQPDAALNSWIDKQLTRYVKNDIATPGDPVRALAERGVLHVQPESLFFNTEGLGVKGLHRIAEEVTPGVAKSAGKSVQAKRWDKTADSFVGVPSAAGEHWGEATLSADPWLRKVPPTTPVFDTAADAQDLGFSHLIDELRNATNPESGLPAELLLKYSSLPQVSVPQAVERVAKINEWRAAQKVAADQARAQNPATHVYKEYAENNPKGFKWVELKAPDTPTLPEGYTLRPEGNAQNPIMGYRLLKDGKPVAWGNTEKEAIQNAHKPALEDALKYEGDTMGHCVGGYCPDVLEGKSRIFSLRSGKGEPHVTIEVKPQKSYGTEHLEKFREQAQKDALASGVNPGTPDDPSAAFLGAVNRRMEELAKENLPLRIQQIKGKANRAPNEEYLPYVQDFVKSGQWSDVGDAQNAGLRKFTDVFNNKELRSLQEAGAELPTNGWLTGEDIQALHNLITPEGKRLTYGPSGNITGGFAAGGIVESQNSGYNADRVEEILTQLRAELA